VAAVHDPGAASGAATPRVWHPRPDATRDTLAADLRDVLREADGPIVLFVVLDAARARPVAAAFDAAAQAGAPASLAAVCVVLRDLRATGAAAHAAYVLRRSLARFGVPFGLAGDVRGMRAFVTRALRDEGLEVRLPALAAAA